MSRKQGKNRQWKRLEKRARKAMLESAILIDATTNGTPGTKVPYKRKVKKA
jgi:hypothetical protein